MKRIAIIFICLWCAGISLAAIIGPGRVQRRAPFSAANPYWTDPNSPLVVLLMDTTNVSQFLDTSGNNNHWARNVGRVIGGTNALGRVEYSAAFGATYTMTNKNVLIPATNDFTLVMHAYPYTVGTKTNILFGNYAAAAGNGRWVLDIQPSLTNNIRLFLGNDAAVGSIYLIGGIPAASNWISVAVERTNKTFRLYADGQLRHSVTDASVRTLHALTNSIGWAAFDPNVGAFTGRLDNVVIYNRSLGTADVITAMQMYNPSNAMDYRP